MDCLLFVCYSISHQEWVKSQAGATRLSRHDQFSSMKTMTDLQPEQQKEAQQQEVQEVQDDVTAIPTLSTEPSVNRLRPWKAGRTSSTAQTQKDKRLSKNWEKRMSERTQAEATKKLERYVPCTR